MNKKTLAALILAALSCPALCSAGLVSKLIEMPEANQTPDTAAAIQERIAWFKSQPDALVAEAITEIDAAWKGVGKRLPQNNVVINDCAVSSYLKVLSLAQAAAPLYNKLLEELPGAIHREQEARGSIAMAEAVRYFPGASRSLRRSLSKATADFEAARKDSLAVQARVKGLELVLLKSGDVAIGSNDRIEPRLKERSDFIIENDDPNKVCRYGRGGTPAVPPI